MAKTKALKRGQNKKLQFITLMIMPLLISLAYILFSSANAWGLEGDHRLKRNPSKQGWEQLQVSFGESNPTSKEEDKENQ